jgi:hypothetical protein
MVHVADSWLHIHMSSEPHRVALVRVLHACSQTPADVLYRQSGSLAHPAAVWYKQRRVHLPVTLLTIHVEVPGQLATLSKTQSVLQLEVAESHTHVGSLLHEEAVVYVYMHFLVQGCADDAL